MVWDKNDVEWCANPFHNVYIALSSASLQKAQILHCKEPMSSQSQGSHDERWLLLIFDCRNWINGPQPPLYLRCLLVLPHLSQIDHTPLKTTEGLQHHSIAAKANPNHNGNNQFKDFPSPRLRWILTLDFLHLTGRIDTRDHYSGAHWSRFPAKIKRGLPSSAYDWKLNLDHISRGPTTSLLPKTLMNMYMWQVHCAHRAKRTSSKSPRKCTNSARLPQKCKFKIWATNQIRT